MVAPLTGVALAVSVTAEPTLALEPLEGAVRETAVGVTAVTEMLLEGTEAPLESMTLAVSVKFPADEVFLGEDKEWLIIYTKEKAKELNVDYFVFGHRHFAIDFAINEKTRYINLGDWIKINSYGVFDGQNMKLLNWNK